jgi:hypothetical protein
MLYESPTANSYRYKRILYAALPCFVPINDTESEATLRPAPLQLNTTILGLRVIV